VIEGLCSRATLAYSWHFPREGPDAQHDTDHSPDSLKPSALAGLTDEVLVGRARNKDVAAFEELLGRYEDKLYRLAMRFVRNENDAQEILQDVFLSAWRNLPGFEGRAQFGSWMYRVTVNAALMFLRARNRHPEVMLDDIEPGTLHKVAEQSVHGSSEDWSQRPDEQFQSEELRRHIQTAVDALPDGLRTSFWCATWKVFPPRRRPICSACRCLRSRHACTAPAWPCVRPSGSTSRRRAAQGCDEHDVCPAVDLRRGPAGRRAQSGGGAQCAC